MRFLTRPPVWGVRGIPAENTERPGERQLAALASIAALRRAVPLLACSLVAAACGGGQSATPAFPALRTLPDLHPPTLRVDVGARGTTPGCVFLAEKGGTHRPSGVAIVDDRGRIVWYHEVPHGLEATDFRAQTYRGRRVLTWWQGTISKAGIGKGE